MEMEPKPKMKPMTFSEMLPGLKGILTKEAIQSITAQSARHTAVLQPRPSEKVFKPMTLDEMATMLQGLKPVSPKKKVQNPSVSKKLWNSSVKVANKNISYTTVDQIKNNPVKKVHTTPLNTKFSTVPRMTNNTEVFKVPKSKYARKSSNFAEETPVSSKPITMRMTIANKENVIPEVKINTKKLVSPKIIGYKKGVQPVLETPQPNYSNKCRSDNSFLQQEKGIEFVKDKCKAVCEQQTLGSIAEVSPPISTPFKDYRNVKDFFNNSSSLEDSRLYEENTITCFDKKLPSNENIRNESVIVSICDLLNKATLRNIESKSTELNELLEIKKQTEQNINMIEYGFKILNDIKKSQLISLDAVNKLVQEKSSHQTTDQNDVNLASLEEHIRNRSGIDGSGNLVNTLNGARSNQCSVIKTCQKSPSYITPKKKSNLRKSVISKSMPNVLDLSQVPDISMNKTALSVYMDMKKHMTFLKTPTKKNSAMLKTPRLEASTSNNLQAQLEKLFN